MSNKKKRLFQNIFLGVLNLILIALAIITSIIYSNRVTDYQNESSLNDFKSNVESMKKVTLNYITSENGYVENWAKYISDNDMSIIDALDFLRDINTNKKRFAHIVDLENHKAYSATVLNTASDAIDLKNYEIQIYNSYFTDNDEKSVKGRKIMNDMYTDTSEHNILGKYQYSTYSVVSVGNRIDVRDENGIRRGFLLLRLIPISDIKETWVFPVGYDNKAEVGIISKDGGYVIDSSTMSLSKNFIEYLLSYHDGENNYVFANDVLNSLATEKNGIIRCNDINGKSNIWYFSAFEGGLDLDILGVVPESIITTKSMNLFIVYVIAGTLIILAIFDGIYIANINHRLKHSAETATKANMAKTHFLSSMSHDMRTPLNTILGLNYLAIDNIHDEKYVLNCLNKSSVAGKQLLTVINDVLDISKIESGVLKINNASTNICELFENLKLIIEPSAKLKNITFDYDYSLVTLKNIYTDKLRLEQIFMNLLSNAVKYTNVNGIIRFEAQTVDLGENKVKLIVVVADNGIGMSEEFQKNMYDSFAREDNDKVLKTQGAGLGLFIVKHAVEALNGAIECNSDLGSGTVFKISIDLEYASDADLLNEKPNDYSRLKGMNLLIAEDNKLNGKILIKLLKKYGITADLAENGNICCDKLFKKPKGTYDAILMDVHMPIMDGIEATKKIRSSNIVGISDIKIIALTADVFQENVNECLKAGMDNHITKPIDIDKLLEILKEKKER